jgi:gliding motility-associated lipoprotein GldJ
MILIKNGMLKKNQNQVNEDVFTSETYTSGQYLGTPGKGQKRDLDPNGAGKRNTTYSDGYLLPNYRLPTEAEWEYAALALVEKNPEPQTKRRRGEEAITDRKVYPWGDTRSTRTQSRNKYRGEYNANYKRTGGDAMGIAGGLNDRAVYTENIYSYLPNAYGLYNMAGNVNEWVLDVYRPGSSYDVDDVNPYRGNTFTKNIYEADGTLSEKDSLGNLTKVFIDSTDLAGRYDRDYTGYDARNIEDGDSTSRFVYDYGNTTLINNDSRVIKGGSWNDRAYWLSPGTRRFMQARHASSTVGFRCVMDRLGSAGFNNDPGGNIFGKRKRG